jgi:hypothetical protein
VATSGGEDREGMLMTMRTGKAIVGLGVLLVVTLLPVVTGADALEEPVPAACGNTLPTYDPETEQLVETTYYFHSDAQAGDVDGYLGLFTGHPDGQYMDTERPTGAVPKVDTNASRSVYPATLPGNPIMTAFYAYADRDLLVACVGWHFWALGDAQDWEVQFRYDDEFILGESGNLVDAHTTSEQGVSEVVATRSLRNRPVTARFLLWAQLEALGGPAAVLYDAADYPSSMTLVTIEPLED